MEIAAKEDWGKFALKLHKIFTDYPCVLARCDMFTLESETFGFLGRDKLQIFMPNIIWFDTNVDREKWANSRCNGKKIAMPNYLDIIFDHVEDLKPKNSAPGSAIFNYLVITASSDRVQVLIYGERCNFPFRVLSK